METEANLLVDQMKWKQTGTAKFILLSLRFVGFNDFLSHISSLVSVSFIYLESTRLHVFNLTPLNPTLIK